jgi:hypothetical protein
MKNKKKKSVEEHKMPAPASGLSKTGIKVIIAGVMLLIIGFFVLSKTDPEGQNLASKLSPFLILGGYVCIGVGIAIPERKQESITVVPVK